jgi:hypothetical protein
VVIEINNAALDSVFTLLFRCASYEEVDDADTDLSIKPYVFIHGRVHWESAKVNRSIKETIKGSLKEDRDV